MKSLLIFVSALFIMCFNTAPAFAAATDNSIATISAAVSISAEQKEKAITLRITGSLKDCIEIKLTDDHGSTLYTENVKNTTLYTKKLVMANLQSGTYNLSVTRKMTRTTESFELTETGLVLNESGRKDILLPYITQKEDKVDVNCMTQSNTEIIIRFYDTEGKLMMEDINHDVFNVNKRFDLSDLSYGVYIIEVSYGDQTEYTTLYYNAASKPQAKHPIVNVDYSGRKFKR